ncbi:hypothetical protein YYY_04175 [Anaplasma phagocytophilum str. Dog2]|nr:hypothetical protein WSQ_04185 [Anaplasma phagocytophilum str. JM]AGR82054.1 hypothetical protein YYY_04175 [Anaplasma phagocytophilum str. Dog2]
MCVLLQHTLSSILSKGFAAKVKDVLTVLSSDRALC